MATYVSYPCKKTKISFGNQTSRKVGQAGIVKGIKGVVGFFTAFALFVYVIVLSVTLLADVQTPSTQKEREFWQASNDALGFEEAMTVEMIEKGTIMTPAEWREWMRKNY
jgi:hypothetical protein